MKNISFPTIWLVITAMMFVEWTNGQFICPPAEAIAPCSCSNTSWAIDCNGRNLNDQQISPILDAFLSPGVSPVATVWAKNNRLTQIPSQICKFTKLTSIDLSQNRIMSIPTGCFNLTSSWSLFISLYSNLITTIPSGAFNFTFTGQFPGSVSLYLANNLITSIQPGALRLLRGRVGSFNFDLQSNQLASFPPDVFSIPNVTYTISLYFNKLKTITPGTLQGTYSYINLGPGNNLTRFECASFKPALQSIQMRYFRGEGPGAVDLSGNSIDCSMCGLTWLIRDHRDLLNYVQNGRCSNGTTFENLNLLGYPNCPFSCK